MRMLVLWLGSMAAAHAAGAAEAETPGAKVTLTGALEKLRWAEGEEITGKATFRLDRAAAGGPKTAVMTGPEVRVEFEPAVSRFWTDVRIEPRPGSLVVVGRPYELTFRIAASEPLRSAADAVKKRIAIFPAGKARARLVVSAGTGWNGLGAEARGVTGRFESPWMEFEVTADPERVFGPAEALAALPRARGEQKGLLAEYALRGGGPPAALAKYFPAADGPMTVTAGDGPFFFSMAPKAEREIRSDAASKSTHTFHSPDVNILLQPGLPATFMAPEAEGLFRVWDDVKGATWGWILVVRPAR